MSMLPREHDEQAIVCLLDIYLFTGYWASRGGALSALQAQCNYLDV